MADAADLNSAGETRAGSNPALGTNVLANTFQTASERKETI